MFLHIGEDTVILKKNIVAILNLNTVDSEITNDYIKKRVDENRIKYITKESHQSVILVQHEKYELYYSPISASTLGKRSSDNK